MIRSLLAPALSPKAIEAMVTLCVTTDQYDQDYLKTDWLSEELIAKVVRALGPLPIDEERAAVRAAVAATLSEEYIKDLFMSDDYDPTWTSAHLTDVIEEAVLAVVNPVCYWCEAEDATMVRLNIRGRNEPVTLCSVCLEELFEQCPNCGEVTQKTALRFSNDVTYCVGCGPDWEYYDSMGVDK